MHRRYLVDIPLGRIMACWPATVHVFLDHNMLCVGCPIAMFHTIIDAADEHGLEAVPLEQALEAVIQAADGSDEP